MPPPPPRLTPEADSLARILWNYHRLDQPLRRADAILALGSNDPRVADHAARLWLDGWAPWLICTGKVGALTAGQYGMSEAAYFAGRAEAAGVPRDRILLEEEATHTGENARFSRALLSSRRLPSRHVIAVQKPYMERRTYATFRQVWPETEVTVSSPPLTYEAYPLEPHLRAERVAEIMVGDFLRVRDYPARGFQIPQPIPEAVSAAAARLIELGYTGHLPPA
jgi:uncharacterized SAM-binding protein YcdF (DUF218 family)